MSRFAITKTYSPDNGWSATFRQWRAKSHCRFLHGYALGVKVTLSCLEQDRDENGWVFDFGGLKRFKTWLQDTFDHKTLVASDDPALPLFQELSRTREDRREVEEPGLDIFDEAGQVLQLIVVDRVGCEAFAEMIAKHLSYILESDPSAAYVVIDSVEVFEHGGNSAIYYPEGV